MRFAPRRWAAALVLFAVAAAARPAAAAEDVLAQVPSDATYVVWVRNPKALSDKLAAVARRRGLDKVTPAAADPLAAAQGALGMTKGLRPDGELAAAMWMDPAGPGAAGGPFGPNMKYLFVVPVADYAAFLGNFANPQKEDGLDVVQFGPAGIKLYAARRGGYAVMASEPPLVGFAPADGGLRSRAVTDGRKTADAVIFQRSDVIMRPMIDLFDQLGNQVAQGLDADLAGKDEQAKHLIAAGKAAVVRGFGLYKQWMVDQLTSVSAVTLTDDGLLVTNTYEAKPGSPSAALFVGLANTDKPLVTGLPAGEYVAVAGAVQDGADAARRLDWITEAAIPELKLAGADGEAALAVLAAERQILAGTTGGALAVAAKPNAAGPQDVSVTAVVKGDAAALSAAAIKAGAAWDEIRKRHADDLDKSAEVKFTPMAKNVGGVPLHRVAVVGVDKKEHAVLVGSAGDRATLVTTETDDAKLAAAVTAARADSDAASSRPEIRAIDKLLPKSRAMVAYVWVGRIVAATGGKAGAWPADLPPVGMSMSTAGGDLRVDAAAPTAVVDALADMIKAAMSPPAAVEPPAPEK